MKTQPWTEDARLQPERRPDTGLATLVPPRRDASERGTDPFERGTAHDPHALEPGWLLGAGFAPLPDVFPAQRAARTWKQRAADLGERLLDAERRTAARVWAPRYPLAGTRYLAGLPIEDRARLAAAFRDATPPRDWRSRQAALEHLESLLPMWPLDDVTRIRGLHVFLGAAGSGKTTLLLKVAHQLSRAARRVGLIVLYPQGPERMTAFRDAGLRVPAPALFVHREAQLEEAVQTLARCDAILVDTPCLLSQPARSRQIARMRLLQHPSSVLHYSLCLHFARAFRRREMAAAAAHRVDFVALSHVDLAPGPGALLAQQLDRPQRISLANAHPDVNGPLVPFGPAALLRALQHARAD